MLNDPLADTMSVILNNEIIGKSECTIKPSSKIIRQLLKVMKDNEYLLDFKEVEDSRGNYIHLKLNGNINTSRCLPVKILANSPVRRLEEEPEIIIFPLPNSCIVLTHFSHFGTL